LRAKQHHQAVTNVERLGGFAYYDYEFAGEELDRFAESPLPRWLLNVAGEDFFHDVVEIRLDAPGETVVSYLPGLARLKRVVIGRQATDEAMKYVGRLHRLEELHVFDASNLSDAGIEQLRALKRLKSIHLTQSRLGDRSLRTLAMLPKLERIVVIHNRFTDDGLLQLAPLRHLKELWGGFRDERGYYSFPDDLIGVDELYGPDAPLSAITKGGVTRLKAMMPSLEEVYR
jgi:hypothetical protein